MNLNEKSVYNISEKVLVDYFQNKKTKSLFIYAVSSMLTAKKGYISVPDYIGRVSHFCTVSTRTSKRWLNILISNGFASIRKGTIHVNGRKKIESHHENSKWYIQFHEEHLKSYSEFQAHAIRQIALLLQRRFQYAWREFKKYSADDLNLEHELALIRSRNKIGCSISKIQEKTGLSKSTISAALKGHTQKQCNYSLPIKGTIARVKYKDLLNKITSKKPREYISYKYGFKYNQDDDTYQLSYTLPSKIITPSYLVKKSK